MHRRRLSFYLLSITTLIIVAISCSSIKSVNEKTTNVELELGNIDKFISLENKLNSKDVTKKHYVDVSEGIYPYIKNHTFDIPKEFVNYPEHGIELRKCYYSQNNEVKLILYEWKQMDTTEVPKSKFKSIFQQLEKYISSKLGSNSSKNIESKTVKDDETYRDDVKWENSEIKAYLFRFGDRENRYNEIRLAVYKD